MQLSPDNQRWLEAFRARHGRAPRILHIGNIANNAYNNAKLLDEAIDHKEGHEIYYFASKNFADFTAVQRCVWRALEENRVVDVTGFLAYVEVSAARLQAELSESHKTDLHGGV